MLELLSKIASHIFIYGTSISFSHDKGKNCIELKLKDFSIKDDEANGIIIENLLLSIENLVEDEKGSPMINDASFIVEKLNLMIHEDWINKILKNEKGLREQGVHNLRIDVSPKKLSILGEYKAGISLAFTVDLKFKLDDGKIVIDLNRFWAGDFLPLPRWIQSALLGILKKHLESKKSTLKGISFKDRFITVDHQALIPVDCYLDIHHILNDEKFLVIQGCTNKEKSLALIKEKALKKRMEQVRLRETELKKQEETRKKKIEESLLQYKKDEELKNRPAFADLKTTDEMAKRFEEMIKSGGERPSMMEWEQDNSEINVTVDGEPPENPVEEKISVRLK